MAQRKLEKFLVFLCVLCASVVKMLLSFALAEC
jgi:hypothetical protein